MDIRLTRWRLQRLVANPKPVLVYAQLLVALASLLGIGVLLWTYSQQNALVSDIFGELAVQVEEERPLPPQDLSRLSHQACSLDTGISNIQSFLQPLSGALSEGGWCGNYVRIFVRFAAEEGYPAHKFHIQSGGRSHTLAEVYYQGKWRVIDPFFNHWYTLPNGDLATYQDLREAPGLLASPTGWGRSDPRLDEIYQGYIPIFPALYRDAPDFYPGLSRNALYHNYFVALSYPLSLFYEGGRRPILPAWFDRPELLGTYALGLAFLVTAAPLSRRWFLAWRNHRKQPGG